MKYLKCIFFALLIGFAAFFLFLAGSIVIDTALGKDRLDAVTNILIPGQGASPDVRAFVAHPAGKGPFPVVIMIHEFFGLNESIVGKVKGLADEGYLAQPPGQPCRLPGVLRTRGNSS